MLNKIIHRLLLLMYFIFTLSTNAVLASEENLISSEELMEKIEQLRQIKNRPKILIIDINHSSYKIEHIEFAVPMKPQDFESYREELKSYGQIVIYCHCPGPEASLAAAAKKLKNMGIENVCILESFVKWKKNGYPLVTKYEKEEISTISVNELLKVYKKKGYYIYDVREKQEYEEGHISGAINVPMGKFISSGFRKTLPKDGRIIVYCRSGHRSGVAVMELKKKGINNAYNLTDGIIEWERKGFLVER